ncbi:hypothetical protein [Chelativorans alearense]|uniref:hypothetical protein n=1 Tax=Chelativorans alearense TaxID=2681495 RepID=UPI0013D60411|nr:hypothetical protein [Chelativorans alearense]
MLTEWPVVELLLLAIWIAISIGFWRGRPSEGGNEPDANERQLGATVIISQMTGILTASSIIIAGTAAFAAILGTQPPANTAAHLRWAAAHAVAALVVAIWVMSALPTRVPTKNVLRSKWVAIFCAVSLFFALVAGVRFVLGIWSFV